MDLIFFKNLCSVYDAGNSVVGVEASEKAVQQFFTENHLAHTVTKIDRINGKLYQVSVLSKVLISKCSINCSF